MNDELEDQDTLQEIWDMIEVDYDEFCDIDIAEFEIDPEELELMAPTDDECSNERAIKFFEKYTSEFHRRADEITKLKRIIIIEFKRHFHPFRQ